MGCAPSKPPVAVTPAEPMPTYEELASQKVKRNPEEPTVYVGDHDYTSTEPLSLIFRQIQQSNKGNSFQVEGLEDKLFHELQINPVKLGIDLRKRLEDMVYMHTESAPKAVIAYAMKHVMKGLNHYLLLRSKPFYEKQAKASDISSPLSDMYPYGSVEFDIEAKIVRVKTVFSSPDGAARGEPTFLMYQCNPKVWIIKRNTGNGNGQISCVVNQWRGVGMKFTCWRMLVVAGEDPILMSLFTHCIASFMEVAKDQRWALHHGEQPVDFNWPQLPDGMEDRLFGHKSRFWPGQ